MKILYVVHASPYDEFSGAPLIAKQYALKSLERGCEVCIITPTFENIDFRRQTPKNINNIAKYPTVLDARFLNSLLPTRDIKPPIKRHITMPKKPAANSIQLRTLYYNVHWPNSIIQP